MFTTTTAPSPQLSDEVPGSLQSPSPLEDTFGHPGRAGAICPGAGAIRDRSEAGGLRRSAAVRSAEPAAAHGPSPRSHPPHSPAWGSPSCPLWRADFEDSTATPQPRPAPRNGSDEPHRPPPHSLPRAGALSGRPLPRPPPPRGAASPLPGDLPAPFLLLSVHLPLAHSWPRPFRSRRQHTRPRGGIAYPVPARRADPPWLPADRPHPRVLPQPVSPIPQHCPARRPPLCPRLTLRSPLRAPPSRRSHRSLSQPIPLGSLPAGSRLPRRPSARPHPRSCPPPPTLSSRQGRGRARPARSSRPQREKAEEPHPCQLPLTAPPELPGTPPHVPSCPQHSPFERGQRAGGGGARPAQLSPLRSASERRSSRGGGAARARIMEGGLCPGPGLQDHPGRPGWWGEEEEEREGFNPGGLCWASGSGGRDRLGASAGVTGPSGSGWSRTALGHR